MRAVTVRQGDELEKRAQAGKACNGPGFVFTAFVQICDSVELDWAFFVVSFYTSANALYFSKMEDKLFMFPNCMMIRKRVTALCTSDLENG